MTDVLNADGIVSGTELENRLQRPAGNELGLGVEQALSRDLLTARLKGGVMVVDENFKIVMIDRRAAKFFGVSSGQSQGKGFYSLFPGLNGSLFASELHEVIIAIGEKRCARPSHNRLLDQFVNAFGAGPESRKPILAISIRAYRDGSNIYGLIRIHFNAQTDSSAPSPATLGHQGQAADSECSQAVAINRNIRFDPDSVLLVVDCHGYISTLSPSAATLFGYSKELLCGSSVRLLFPDLSDQDGPDICQTLTTLAEQNPQGYILAATSEGDSRRLDIQIFSCADPSEELILLCRDRTHSSLVAEELANRGRLFDCAAKSVADAVLVVDAEGFVTEMNPMAEQLLGFELDTSKTMQIEAVMPLANEETGVRVTPVHDALTQATNIQETESLLLKIRGAEPMPVAVSAFPMRDAMNRMQKCLVILRPLSEARRVSSRLRWQSMHDTLTGLPNRKSLAERLQRSIESAKLEGSIHALLYIDLYNFSVINDTSGHMAGDELLVQFARLLMEITGPSDIAARIGNDEFALLLHCINYDKAMAMAEQVLEVIKDFSIPWEGETLRVGASIGGIMNDSEALSDIDLMISAGSSCAAARDKGRNKIHFQSFNEEVTKRRRLATSMPKIVSALDENRFTLFAQLIVSLNPNVALPKYYEILVRMRDSDGTIVPPSEFIPVAEHFSLIDDLDKWVFTNALKFLQKRQKRGELLPTLAVNLSGTTVGDENAIDYILAGFSDSGIPPKHIQFEITETAAVKHLPEAKRLIATLRSVGVSFALDDFGSGLSSFAYLKELPIDCLKIDASFIKTMDNSDVDYSVVSTINHLGHIMGVSTVAEGVESKSQHQLLKKIGVDYIQGFLVKHPQLLDKIIDPI
ncbi:EAL domain-containing protein [Porticoccaceae bacterium]|nr:EAL domain-containing protein [Porticoccaceae bacterium]